MIVPAAATHWYIVSSRICIFICALASGSQLLAQSNDNAPSWQAMRVYVPEDQVDSVVPRDYLTTDIDDLERQLAEESRRRAQSAGQAMGIQKAVYLARWNDQLLVSDTSMWEVALPGNSQPLNIGRTSVAIDDPVIAPVGSKSLTRHLRYVDDTRLQLLDSGNEQTMWFGFKTKTRRGESGQQSVDLVFPRAALATMLIAVPANATVKANLPLARSSEPDKFLPDNWPQGALPLSGTGEHWYVVHLSGRERCSLSFTPAPKANQFPFRTSVANAQCDMVVQPSGLQANCRYQFTKAPASNALRIRIEEPLHVRSVQVNGVETTRWRSISEEPLDDKLAAGKNSSDAPAVIPSRLIEVTLESPDEGPLLLAVEAIAQLPMPYVGTLPRVEIAGAFVIDGRGSFTSAENVQIEDVQCQKVHLSTTSAAGYASWQWQWTGRAPQVSTRLRSSTNQWTVRSLTRFNVQTDVIVATAQVQLSSGNVRGNQVAFKLANGWFVDSVALENAPSGVSTSIRESNGRGAELYVRWEDRRSDLDVRIAINAHYPQRTEVDNLRLQSTRIVTLPGADQVDTYAVESSGRFQVEIDPELLRLRISEDELVSWQRELLPRLADVWIFQGTRSNMPPIRLRRVRSTLDAKLHTTVTQDKNETIVSYRVICQPISGSVDQLRIMLPIPLQEVAPTWSLAAAVDEAYPRGLLVTSRATSSSGGETTFFIELSQDMAEPFQLEAELRLTGKDAVDEIPLPSMPQAVTQDAVVLLPTGFALPEGVVGLEILPSGMVTAEGKLLTTSLPSTTEVTVARYDPSIVSHLHVQRPGRLTSGAWVRQALHEHWHHNGGRSLHRTAWDIALPSPRVIEVTLPAAWDFESMSVNGQRVDAIEQTDRKLHVKLPNSNSVRVELQCSNQTPSGWWGNISFDEPDCGLSALESRRVVWFPGTVVADHGWRGPSNLSLADRLLPSAWWHWLSIDPWHDLISAQATNSQRRSASDSHPVLALLSDSPPLRGNWWPLVLDPRQGSDQIWHADRSLVSAWMLAIALITGAVIYYVCGPHLSRWWISSSAAVAALCIVPEFVLLPVQLFALALTAAALVRISFAVMACSLPVAKSRDSYPSSLISSARSLSMLMMALAVGSASARSVYAQPLTPDEPQDREEIFGILIPIDSEFQMAGDYVYVPMRLSRLLSNSNQQDAKNLSVAVQAAFYSLRVSNDPVTLTSSVGELTAELTIQSMQPDAELRLQFSGRELELQRAFLDSQEIFQGQRLKHDADALTWRATDADRHTLRLIFRPRTIVEKDGRGMLSVGIPAIPTARLEVMGDDLRDVTVDSVGGTQLETPRFLTAQLGPANRLMLSWPLIINRGAAVQVQSDTWIHTRGDQILAQCQLRVRGATALPTVLHVVGDNNWQPVGQEWEDCRLLDADGASATGRPVYSVQRSGDMVADTLTIRVLLLARPEISPQALSIPFLALQEAAPQQRTLAISHAESALWKPVGTETWQPLPAVQATTLWEKSRLSEQPALLRVPTGTVIAMLQRTSPPAALVADETTEISLQNPEIKIKYTARWAQPVVGESAIRLHIPSGLRVDGAFIDALPARHTSHRVARGGGEVGVNEVIVFIDGSRSGMHSVNLQMSGPARLSRAVRLPRPLLLDTKIGSSVVQIFRGAELSSDIKIVDEADIRLEKVEVRPSPLLLNLHTMVGQVELNDRFRDSPELPIEVRLSRPSTNRIAQAVVKLMRADQGWTAQIDAIVDASQGEVNHVFFDMASGLAASFREPLDANVPMMLWPSADTNRAILGVLPQLDSEGKSQITIKIRLPSAGASQSVTVPDIRLIGLSVQRPVLAVPKTIAGEEVRWTQVGRPLPDNWLDSNGLEHLDLDGYTVHESTTSQFQAMWHSRQTEDQTARVLLTRVQVIGDGRSGEIFYWIDPRNQAYLTARLPEGCQVIGAQLGSNAITWTQSDRESMRILLQPSYLPVQLKLFVRWTQVAIDSGVSTNYDLPLPELDARSAGDMLVGVQRISSQPQFGSVPDIDAVELSLTQAEQLLAKAWVNTLVQAAPTADDRQSHELAGWLSSWQPAVLGVADINVAVPKQFLPSDSATAANGANGTATGKTSAFWDQYARLLDIDPKALAITDSEGSSTDAAIQWYRLNQPTSTAELTLSVADRPRVRLVLEQLLAAGALLLISIALWSAQWSWLKQRMSALTELVWPLWVGLAIATWMFLPVSWPSLIIVSCALTVLWRRYRELKRDRQFVLPPRALH